MDKRPRGQPTDRSNAPSRLPRILWVVSTYAAFAALWIAASDWLLGLVLQDPVLITAVSTIKGWAFVAVTSLLLFVLLRRLVRGIDASGQKPSEEQVRPAGTRQLLIGFSLLAGLILVLSVGTVSYVADKQKTDATAQLKTIAGFKAGQVTAWLGERRRDAELIRSGAVFGDELGRWRLTGDPSRHAKLLNQLEDYRRALGYRAVWLLDAAGQRLMAAGASGQPVAPELLATARRASAGGQVLVSDFYRVATTPIRRSSSRFRSPCGTCWRSGWSKAAPSRARRWKASITTPYRHWEWRKPSRAPPGTWWPRPTKASSMPRSGRMLSGLPWWMRCCSS